MLEKIRGDHRTSKVRRDLCSTISRIVEPQGPLIVFLECRPFDDVSVGTPYLVILKCIPSIAANLAYESILPRQRTEKGVGTQV